MSTVARPEMSWVPYEPSAPSGPPPTYPHEPQSSTRRVDNTDSDTTAPSDALRSGAKIGNRPTTTPTTQQGWNIGAGGD